MNSDNLKLLASLNTVYKQNMTIDVYKQIVSFIDATTLNVTDSSRVVQDFTKRVLAATDGSKIPSVASICVAPQFIEDVGIALGNNCDVAITSVCAGFPLSHTFIEVKMLECAMAVENGADEIDIVIDLGEIIEGREEMAQSEIVTLREEIGDDIILKVIIETGELKTEELIRSAVRAAIGGGADFVKTSTGKTKISATPNAVVIICEEIKRYYEESGNMVGVKVAGGIATVDDAVKYYTIVESILGKEWLTAELFRIGSSSLLDKIIVAIGK